MGESFAFETAFGIVRVSWRDDRLSSLEFLQQPADLGLHSRKPAWVTSLARKLARHLDGASQDFRDVPLATADLPPFHRKVYEAALAIPPGKTLTYGELAIQLGAPKAARAVGQALRRNPFPIVVPCHRVLAKGGAIGGFSAPGGVSTKRKLLALEGIRPGVEPEALVSERARTCLAKADRTLGKLIARIGPYTLEPRPLQSPFAALAESIVYQQLAGYAAKRIFERFAALFPRKRLSPECLLGMSDDTLRSSGLSRGKIAALRDLAHKTQDGTVPTSRALGTMTEDEIVARLTTIRGIGRWTVEMVLIFRLGRPDVLPIDDYGVRKGFAQTFGLDELPTPRELASYGERWRPFRTAASWYLWRALDEATLFSKT